MLFLGLDPGGLDAFGWALLEGEYESPRFVDGAVCTGADVAVDQAARSIGARSPVVGADRKLSH
jgi:hypothetical protein